MLQSEFWDFFSPRSGLKGGQWKLDAQSILVQKHPLTALTSESAPAQDHGASHLQVDKAGC